MIGKKNVVFGFIFLLFTASLGPVMVMKYGGWGQAFGEKQQIFGQLQTLKAEGFEKEMDPLTAEQIAKMNTDALLSLNKLAGKEMEIDMIKGGPHAHGNLESLVNIVVGIALCFIAAPRKLKQAISWAFIIGTVMHGGMLYLERVFHMEWAGALLSTGIGPILILLGFVTLGLTAWKGWQGKVVEE